MSQEHGNRPTADFKTDHRADPLSQREAASSHSDLLRAEQVNTVLKRANANNVIQILNAAVTATVLFPHVNGILAAAWGAVLGGTALVLLVIARMGRDRPRIEKVSPALWRLTTLRIYFFGVMWGIAAIFLFPQTSPLHQLFLAAVIAGMMCGCAGTIAAMPRAAIGFILATGLPLALAFLLADTATHLALAAMTFFFTCVMTLTVRSNYNAFRESIEAGLKNDDLLADMRAMRADLVDAIATTPEAFALFDREERLILWNDKFARVMRLESRDVEAGLTYRELLILTFGDGAATLAVKIAIEEELAHFRKAQETRVWQPYEGCWLKSTHRRTQTGGTVTAHVDVTRMKETESELIEAKREAEYASQTKSRFLANMSHELRTPLNAIIGFADLIRSESLGPLGDKRYKGYADDIATGGRHLSEIIGDILDISKIESGKVEIAECVIDIRDILNSCLAMLRDRSESKRLRIETDLPADLPGLRADQLKVKQVALNLLSNAVKFTPSQGAIRIEANAHGAQGLRFSVADTGIGIKPDDVPVVLEPFRQIDSTLSRHYAGTGLGLPISKSFMELHGGRLEIESEPDKGTKVTCTFPAERIVVPETPTQAAGSGI